MLYELPGQEIINVQEYVNGVYGSRRLFHRHRLYEIYYPQIILDLGMD